MSRLLGRTREEARTDKLKAMNQADAAGLVADSMEVRMDLIRRMQAGELTFDQMQAELKRIKRDAKKAGKLTREQAFRRG